MPLRICKGCGRRDMVRWNGEDSPKSDFCYACQKKEQIKRRKEKNKECKRHRWRMGAKSARIINGDFSVEYSTVWCERCNKELKAYHNSISGEKNGKQ